MTFHPAAETTSLVNLLPPLWQVPNLFCLETFLKHPDDHLSSLGTIINNIPLPTANCLHIVHYLTS